MSDRVSCVWCDLHGSVVPQLNHSCILDICDRQYLSNMHVAPCLNYAASFLLLRGMRDPGSKYSYIVSLCQPAFHSGQHRWYGIADMRDAVPFIVMCQGPVQIDANPTVHLQSPLQFSSDKSTTTDHAALEAVQDSSILCHHDVIYLVPKLIRYLGLETF